MAIQKRKAVHRAMKGAAAVAVSDEDEHDDAVSDAKCIEDVDEEEAEPDAEDPTELRCKELKAMPVDDLKELVLSFGLEKGKKTDMVDSVLNHEARLRQIKQEREENLRKVVVEKTQELSSMAINTLKEQCLAVGITGNLSKTERTQRLLAHWQDNDGVNKALAQIRCNKREAELTELEEDALCSLCEEAEIDMLVKEVMIDRILRKETHLGNFDPPVLPQAAVEKKVPESDNKADLVATLLANEAARAQRKLEEEKLKEKQKQEEKKKEILRGLTVAELKQKLGKFGMATTGTKDELVENLYHKEIEDEALGSRKADLKALGKDGLKELLATKGLEPGSITDMIEALLAYEARCEQNVKDYEVKVMEQLKIKKAELDSYSANALKEMCSEAGLTPGVSAEERVQRLLRHARQTGQIDRDITVAAQTARRAELEAKDKPALKTLCEKLEVGLYVKAVLVERLLHYEREAGNFAKDADDDAPAQPPAKKHRKK